MHFQKSAEPFEGPHANIRSVVAVANKGSRHCRQRTGCIVRRCWIQWRTQMITDFVSENETFRRRSSQKSHRPNKTPKSAWSNCVGLHKLSRTRSGMCFAAVVADATVQGRCAHRIAPRVLCAQSRQLHRLGWQFNPRGAHVFENSP